MRRFSVRPLVQEHRETVEMSGKPWIRPVEILIRHVPQCDRIFWWDLMRYDVLEGHRFAAGEGNELARIRDAWREPRITKRIVQRRPEIFVQRFIRIVRIAGVISVNPGLRCIAAHVTDNSSAGRTPCQPDGGSRHTNSNLLLTYERLVRL